MKKIMENPKGKHPCQWFVVTSVCDHVLMQMDLREMITLLIRLRQQSSLETSTKDNFMFFLCNKLLGKNMFQLRASLHIEESLVCHYPCLLATS